MLISPFHGAGEERPAPHRAPRATFAGRSLALLLCFGVSLAQADDQLPSWNDTDTKKAIVGFVEKVTKQGSPDFVPVAERIAVFDNDGTLWSEHPMYFQVQFAIDRVRALAPQHPERKDKEPFASIIKGGQRRALSIGCSLQW